MTLPGFACLLPGAVGTLFRRALADQPFLCHRRYKPAVAGKDAATAEAACALAAWAILRVKQPLIGAEGAVEPHRMVEARHHDARVEHQAAMRGKGGIEEREVGC